VTGTYTKQIAFKEMGVLALNGLGFRIVSIFPLNLACSKFHGAFILRCRNWESIHLKRPSIDDSKMKGNGDLT